MIKALEQWVFAKKSRTYIPPAFYDRDGSFVQPPSFEMPAYQRKVSKKWTEFAQKAVKDAT